MDTSNHSLREDLTPKKRFSQRKISKLFHRHTELSPENLPYQHRVKDFFVVKQIGDRSLSFSGKINHAYERAKSKYTEMSKRSPVKSYLAMMMLMIGGIALFDTSGNLFKASLTENVPAFNGAVYPFPKAPSWFDVGGANKRLYSSYKPSELVPAPRYDITLLKSKDEWVRGKVNTKITYPIVYMGQYKFNHLENKGSHPAVDIKLAKGTPVLSISNGVVVKSEDKTTGYGKHVVIKHVGVPEYGTLYSSYCHMSKLEVKVGQIVKKGEEIGKVGSTGSSTTPHIHFQIDKASAPFHPYWPFTWNDAKKAGVSYTDAVNIGLGSANGNKYTINPFDFINKYQNFSGGLTAQKTKEPLRSAAPSAKPVSSKTSKSAVKSGSEMLKKFEIIASPEKILEGDSVFIKISALNSKNSKIKDFNERVEVTYADGKDAQKISVPMRKGYAERKITFTQKGRSNVRVKYKNIFKTVSVMVAKRPVVAAQSNTTVKGGTFDHFVITGEKAVREGESIVLKVQALDANGNAISSNNFPQKGNYPISVSNGIVSPNKIEKGDFANGEFIFRMKGKKRGKAWVKIKDAKYDIIVMQSISSQESLDTQNTKIAQTGTKIFTDVYSSNEHAKAISYLKAHNIISGYSDGSFKPSKTVSRAEAIKMIFSAFDITSKGNIDSPFNDIAEKEWFTPFVLAAYDLNIVNGYSDGSFKPSKKVNRSEYFKIFLASGDVVLPKTATSKPFSDTEKVAWFAPYAEFAKDEKLLDFGSNFYPTKEITRGEVAETIYRFLK